MPKNSMIRVGTIENAGPTTLALYLRNAGSASKQIDIAVAFVTAAGLLRVKRDACFTRKLSSPRFERFVENLKELAK